MVAQLIGGAVAVGFVAWLYPHVGESAGDVVIPHERPDHEPDTTPRNAR